MSSNQFYWWFLPYCLKQVEKGRYLVLNKEYKSVGMFTDEPDDYEPYTVKIRMTNKMAKTLSFDESPNIEQIYLYSDGCIPTTNPDHMEKYLQKINKLMDCKIDDKRRTARGESSIMNNAFFRMFLPYRLKQFDERYVVINRYTSPIGFYHYWGDEAHKPYAVKIEITIEMAKILSFNESPDIKLIFLYNDDSTPTNRSYIRQYFEKISKLATCRVSF